MSVYSLAARCADGAGYYASIQVPDNISSQLLESLLSCYLIRKIFSLQEIQTAHQVNPVPPKKHTLRDSNLKRPGPEPENTFLDGYYRFCFSPLLRFLNLQNLDLVALENSLLVCKKRIRISFPGQLIKVQMDKPTVLIHTSESKDADDVKDLTLFIRIPKRTGHMSSRGSDHSISHRLAPERSVTKRTPLFLSPTKTPRYFA